LIFFSGSDQSPCYISPAKSMSPFLVQILILLSAVTPAFSGEKVIMTTGGPISAEQAGLILPHEHIFTDLRGPEAPGYGEADSADVVRVMKPLLLEAKKAGVNTIVECTTIGVGRNVEVVARLAKETGLNIVIPTGVYGRAHFAPKAYAEQSETELAHWMISEVVAGIEKTGLRAGFIKTAASETELRPLEEKFLRAAGRASRQAGVAIASHTTSGSVARNQLDILTEMEIPADRFIWVHAQSETDLEFHQELGRRGAYIELDSVGASEKDDEKIIRAIEALIEAKLEDRILLSQDAGWYNPGQLNGGKQRGYTLLITSFKGKLQKAGLKEEQIRRLTQENPFRAFSRLR
jgi:phosphotriesterase-related protein